MPLVELPGFEEAVRNKWRGSTLPTLFEGKRLCPQCVTGELMMMPAYIQDALFFHGGYGESTRETVAVCTACHKASVLMVESLRPPKCA